MSPAPLRPKTPRRNSLTFAILSGLATGALRLEAIVAISLKPRNPTSRSINRWFYEMNKAVDPIHVDVAKLIENTKKRRQLSRAIQTIQRRRFAKIVRSKNRLFLEITEEGRKRLLPYMILQISLEPQKTWDRRWRIILFDIPEKQRVGRDVLRKKLQDLGFFQLQKSAFVFPYPCFDQIDMLLRALEIFPYVTFFETDSLGYHEAAALTYFKLIRESRLIRKSR